MKTVILCGGRGTRLDEMGKAVPKALVSVGGKPLIWHLLRSFASRGFDDFILCLGFLGDKIEQYFEEFAVDRSTGDRHTIQVCSDGLECRLTLAQTGTDTNTGGRIKAIQQLVPDGERFFATYGDGVADVDQTALLDFHLDHGRVATLSAVNPISSFGILDLGEDSSVVRFREKPRLENWINGGFFVFENSIFNYLDADSILEREPLTRLANEGQLMAYRHRGFWKCMDTYKDNLELEQLWKDGAPWKTW